MTSSSVRLASAKKIKKWYLAPGAIFPIEWPELTDPSIGEVLVRLFSTEASELSTFDDIAFFCLQSMENAYLGGFNPKAENSSFCDFKKSPFAQAMRNDLGVTVHLTESQYRRAIERVMAMCCNINMEPSKWESICVILGDVALDQDMHRNYQKNRRTVNKSTVGTPEEPGSANTLKPSPRTGTANVHKN